MIIRSFCLADSVRVPRLLEEALDEECYEHTILLFANQLAWDSDLLMVASVDDQVVALIIGAIEKEKGLYHRVVVHPGFRNMGIGRQLIQRLQERFIQRKVKSIAVREDSFNQPLMTLWLKMNQIFDADLTSHNGVKLSSRL